ncbi:MAG TPA: fibronectin type III domain-containing protein, partial [Desulfomonilaceae bacterium]|nr:fibronectin type III domain-containing protein [Desulfomonilaceae bacterium]
EQRLANGMSTLGFANPTLYQIATGTGYGAGFHDIADGSTNLFYLAATGYDNATGWGSFNGANLMAALAPVGLTTPTGLTATAGKGSVTLSWTTSSGATSYNVYRGTASGQEGATPIRTGITATTYTDTVTNGVTYYYKVSATNGIITSASSNEVSATPYAVAPPTGLTAVAGNGSVTLRWTASPGATSYKIYRGTASGQEGSTPIRTGITTTTYTDRVANGVTYYYEVSATSSAGTSPLSSEVSATPVAPPAAPRILTYAVNSQNPPAAAVTINWASTATNATFTIQRATNTYFTSGLVSWSVVNATTYLDSTAAVGNRYYYRVRASNTGGNSPWSNVVTVITIVPPSNVTAGTPSRTSIQLTWVNDSTTGITGFSIQRATNAAFTAGLFTTTATPGTLTSRTITGLTPNTTYYFRVAARTATGSSAWSNIVSAATLP